MSESLIYFVSSLIGTVIGVGILLILSAITGLDGRVVRGLSDLNEKSVSLRKRSLFKSWTYFKISTVGLLFFFLTLAEDLSPSVIGFNGDAMTKYFLVGGFAVGWFIWCRRIRRLSDSETVD